MITEYNDRNLYEGHGNLTDEDSGKEVVSLDRGAFNIDYEANGIDTVPLSRGNEENAINIVNKSHSSVR